MLVTGILALLSGCSTPGSLRKGPEKISLQPLIRRSLSGVRETQTATDHSLKLEKDLASAQKLAQQKVLSEQDAIQLRQLLAQGMAENDQLRDNLKKAYALFLGMKGAIEDKDKQIDAANKAYKDQAISEVHHLQLAIWKERIFGWPIALLIGAVGGGIVTFLFKAAISAFLKIP